MNGIRIIRVLTRLGAGGPPIHCLTATREMTKLGYDATLVTGRCGPGEGDMSYLVREDDPVVRMPSLTPLGSVLEDVRTLFALWRMFRRERPQIVHTHTARAGAIGRLAAWLAQVPVIVHTYHGHVMRGYFSPWKSRLVVLIEKLLARLTTVICVLSPKQAKELGTDIRIAALDKIRVVPLGMDLTSFQSLPEPSDDGTICVGWLGRLVPVKGIPLLVDVIDRVLASDDRVRFCIAGDGPERETLERALPRWGDRVKYLGWVEDVAPIIDRCHLLLQTSKAEGTPVSLIQGMAAGRPFVASAVGGVPDLAQDHANGIVCKASGEDLAAAVLLLAYDSGKRRSMGRAAAQFAAQHYSTQRLASDLDALYKGLVAAEQPVREIF